MKQEAEFFGEDVELILLYIAKRLKEALKLEALLDEAGLDYLVEPDRYRGGLIFQTERVGVFFYVAPKKDEDARKVLMEKGFKPYSME